MVPRRHFFAACWRSVRSPSVTSTAFVLANAALIAAVSFASPPSVSIASPSPLPSFSRASRRFGLSDLVGVMNGDVVLAAAVNIEVVTQVLG